MRGVASQSPISLNHDLTCLPGQRVEGMRVHNTM